MYRTNYIANSYALFFTTMSGALSYPFILMHYSILNTTRITHPTKCPLNTLILVHPRIYRL